MQANTEKGLGLGGETSQQSQVSLSKAEVVGLRLLFVDTRITHLILNLKVYREFHLSSCWSAAKGSCNSVISWESTRVQGSIIAHNRSAETEQRFPRKFAELKLSIDFDEHGKVLFLPITQTFQR